MQWWGYSKEHGWVVLDRSIPSNFSGLKTDLLFFRCRDSTTFSLKRERWTPPAYRYAPNHLRELAPLEAEFAAAEFEGLKARWPEFEHEIQREYRESGEHAEAVRVEAAKTAKQAASKNRKNAALLPD